MHASSPVYIDDQDVDVCTVSATAPPPDSHSDSDDRRKSGDEKPANGGADLARRIT
jgi:hypothetical protein